MELDSLVQKEFHITVTDGPGHLLQQSGHPGSVHNKDRNLSPGLPGVSYKKRAWSLFKLKKLFKKKEDKTSRTGLGILVFENTSEVIQAEKILRENNWEIRVMGPPPEIQSGCDLVIEFPLIKELTIIRLLEKEGLPPLDMVPVTNPLLQPVDLFHVKDFGRFFMIRAANMKITVEKQTRIIVNISGGGCPDVPYLAFRLVGKSLDQAPDPMDIGHTLCGYALGLAFKEMKKQCLQW